MANLKTIQFLRNANLATYANMASAKDALIAKAQELELLDGSPIAGRYTVTVSGTPEVRTILGVVYVSGSTTGVTFFNNDKEFENVLSGLDYGPIGGTDASVLTQIQQADGMISGLTANVGTLKLTGYSKGSDSGSVASTDSINAAISKLENQIDAEETAREAAIEALDYNLAADDNKVVVSLNQTDGAVSGTSVNISGIKLAGYAEAAATGDVDTTDTLGEALGKLQKTIHEMDKDAFAVDGQVVTTVSEADGVVSETKANVKDLQLGGYAKTNDTGDIASGDTINVALSKLENQIGANEISNADGSIAVTPSAAGTDIAIKIKSGENVIKLDGEGGGIYTNLNVVKLTESLPATVKERYELRDSDNVKIGESIDIAKDSHIVSITYISNPSDAHYQNLQYVYIDASGATQTEYVDVSALVLEAEFASGVTVTNHVAHGVVDPASESFFTVGAYGFKVAGISGFVQNSIEALDVAVINPGAGKYIYAIEENDGKIAASGANVSEAVLNNYAKGTDGTAVASTDTVNQAIGKLENQIDAAEAAAKTVVAEGTDAGNNMSIVETAGGDGHKIFTINLTDVASDSALTAEITARKAVDGQNGDTYAANTSANYISSATSLNDADVKLDTALKGAADNLGELSGKVETLSGKAVTAVEMTGGTAAIAAAEDGTKKITINTDGSQILATNFNASASSGTPAATDSVSDVLSKLYANAKMDAVKAGSATTVVAAANGTTVDVKLDESSALSVNNNDGNGNNALMITSDGLFLSKDWDCGTF